MQTFNDRKADALYSIKQLVERIEDKTKELNNIELDINALKINLNQILQQDFDCFAWWHFMDSIVKKEKGWKEQFKCLTKKFIPEGAKEIFCENIEEKFFDGQLRYIFFYKERYFEFNFLAPRERYFDIKHGFGYHTADVYEKGNSPYMKYHKNKKNICRSYDIDEIKNAPENYIKEKIDIKK